MKQEERKVREFLINQGYNSIMFEPLGKSKPPDFLIEGNIGIEVRRLNKHIKTNESIEPIENLQYKFVPKFKQILKELENTDLPYSIYVSLNYKRPIKITNRLLLELKNSIISSTKAEIFSVNIKFNKQITYSLYKTEFKSDQTYELRLISDNDSLGNVQDVRYDALVIAINEKSKKLKDIKSSFSKLWLILVDDIFSRVDNTTKWDLQKYPKIKSNFDRIILVSKVDVNMWIDLYPWIGKLKYDPRFD